MVETTDKAATTPSGQTPAVDAQTQNADAPKKNFGQVLDNANDAIGDYVNKVGGRLAKNFGSPHAILSSMGGETAKDTLQVAKKPVGATVLGAIGGGLLGFAHGVSTSDQPFDARKAKHGALMGAVAGIVAICALAMFHLVLGPIGMLAIGGACVLAGGVGKPLAKGIFEGLAGAGIGGVAGNIAGRGFDSNAQKKAVAQDQGQPAQTSQQQPQAQQQTNAPPPAGYEALRNEITLLRTQVSTLTRLAEENQALKNEMALLKEQMAALQGKPPVIGQDSPAAGNDNTIDFMKAVEGLRNSGVVSGAQAVSGTSGVATTAAQKPSDEPQRGA